MFITQLKIHNFRNLISKDFRFTNRVNVFYGLNGVGKTSILEAIHYTSSGKSFRKCSFKNLINNKSQNLTVYLEAEIKDHPFIIAVNKSRSGLWTAKLNNNKISKQSIITNELPVVSIDPEVYRLVDFGPIYRRNFIDWMVFHVKHDYLVLWKKVHKCIKQLNHLYKIKAKHNEIEPWENIFINYSEELNKTREHFFKLIKDKVINFSSTIQNEVPDLRLSFKKGWSEEYSLKEQLFFDKEKNMRYGQLQHGPHKMDIKIMSGNQPASQILSRGQKKVLSIIFYMAYIEVLLEKNIKPILCLDDFDAELDTVKLSKISAFFKKTNMQIFLTSVQRKKISKVYPKAQMFHVKH